MSFFESGVSAALGQGQAGKVFLAAVSGGADSTAMLAAFAALRDKAGFALHCVHVEHGIRAPEESGGDAKAVEALCGNLGVPCRVVVVPAGRIAAFARESGVGVEAAARLFRHRILKREARRLKADRILTGHTRDDLMETILMRILRGAGPAGLAPMPKGRGRLLRPLLGFTRQDVLAYLAERGLPYRTDSTNSDIRFLRNRVRLKLVPLLDEFFPSWRPSLQSLAETQALAAEFLRAEAKKRLPWDASSLSNGAKESALKLDERDFFGAPRILREEAVFLGADILAGTVKKQKHASAFLGCKRLPRRAAVRRAVARENGAAAMQAAAMQALACDLGPVRLEAQNGFVSLKPVKKAHSEKGFSFLIKEEGLYTFEGRLLGTEKNLLIRAESAPGKEDCKLEFFAACSFPVVFRNHKMADCIIRGGHKRRLSDILNSSTRSKCTEVITACDAEGPAAFIAVGPDVKVIGRDGIEDRFTFSFKFEDINV